MDLTHYFLLPDGRLRAGWRLLLFVVLSVLSLILFSGVTSLFWLPEPPGSPRAILVATTVSSAILAASSIFPTWLMMFHFEHQPFSAVGLIRQREWRREMALGLAGGMALVGTITIAEWGVGAIYFEGSGTGVGSASLYFFAATGIFSVAATTEELLFRGYGFQRLVEGSNGPIAVGISSVVFGVLHASNPHATRLSILTTILAGVLLSVAYLKTRALWLPIGFHFSWNWTLSLAGLPVSGLEIARMPWHASASSEHLWLHGGDYGPEGGVVASVALAVGIVYLLLKKINSAGPAKEPAASLAAGENPPGMLP